MVVDGEKGFLSNQETATNGCEEQHNRRRGLTKGQLESAQKRASTAAQDTEDTNPRQDTKDTNVKRPRRSLECIVLYL